jgi:mRNA interferase MazF
VRRAEIRWADLGPRAGRRPVLIVTRTGALPVLTTVVVAPITTTTVRGIDSEVLVGAEEGLQEDSVANCDALMSVRKARMARKAVGALASPRLPELDRALRFALEIRY